MTLNYRAFTANKTLTEREELLIKLVADAYKYREIAACVGTTEQCIKNQMRAVFDKTGMSTKLELAMWFMANQTNTEYWNQVHANQARQQAKERL